MFGLKANIHLSALFVCVLHFLFGVVGVCVCVCVCVRSAGFWKQVDYVGAEGFTVGAQRTGTLHSQVEIKG